MNTGKKLVLAACAAFVVFRAEAQLNPTDKGSVSIEYIAHACFRVTSPAGKQVLIDPFASRVWLGYDFPTGLHADAVLITHPHYDHDGSISNRLKGPWPSGTTVLRSPGTNRIGDIMVIGIRGKHADPWGKEFGQINTIWLLEVSGVRIVHLGDNGPIGDSLVKQIDRVDVLMIPIDSKYHILKANEIAAIRQQLSPNVLIPMHYRHPDLEASSENPEGLGGIEAWAEKETNVQFLKTNKMEFAAASLPKKGQVLIFEHSPLVKRP